MARRESAAKPDTTTTPEATTEAAAVFAADDEPRIPADEIEALFARVSEVDAACTRAQAHAHTLSGLVQDAARELRIRKDEFARSGRADDEEAFKVADAKHRRAEQAATEAEEALLAVQQERSVANAALSRVRDDAERCIALRPAFVKQADAAAKLLASATSKAEAAEATLRATEAKLADAERSVRAAQDVFDEDPATRAELRRAEDERADVRRDVERARRLASKARERATEAESAHRKALASVIETDTARGSVTRQCGPLRERIVNAWRELVSVYEAHAAMKRTHDEAMKKHRELVGTDARLSGPFPTIQDIADEERHGMVRDGITDLAVLKFATGRG